MAGRKAGFPENSTGLADRKARLTTRKPELSGNSTGAAGSKGGSATNKVGLADPKAGMSTRKPELSENKHGLADRKRCTLVHSLFIAH
ncbi:hypothetical protein BXY64_2652 [Marinifilum flexuosum]|uniref:Uncharacterized protein n=2 Tax=Marinifilum flexuosum TaxID=1117708 RepID=A0A419X4C1_9BACT|nr:hypothetical protein BXY64_2652 [Marinifilum flexuosum]